MKTERHAIEPELAKRIGEAYEAGAERRRREGKPVMPDFVVVKQGFDSGSSLLPWAVIAVAFFLIGCAYQASCVAGPRIPLTVGASVVNLQRHPALKDLARLDTAAVPAFLPVAPCRHDLAFAQSHRAINQRGRHSSRSVKPRHVRVGGWVGLGSSHDSSSAGAQTRDGFAIYLGA